MGFASAIDERYRVGILAILAVAIELLFLSGLTYRMTSLMASWPLFAQILGSLIPRLVLMILLTVVFSPIRKNALCVVLFGLYTLLMFFQFRRSEVYVAWGSVTAVSRVVLPYLAGIVGAVIGVAVGRRALT